ncbi:MAG: hypothetical protein AAF721_28450 [Myxococcota bacterium]
MAQAHHAPAGGTNPVVRALLLTGWIGLTDLWLKLMARAGGCTDAPAVADMLRSPWALPSECPGAPLLGTAVQLAPTVRDGGPFGLLPGTFGGVMGQIWGLSLIALAVVVTILVVRWRYRHAGDTLALGVLWGACGVLALPRLLGTGGVAEITVAGVSTGIGDAALAWALGWLVWRAIAEARA